MYNTQITTAIGIMRTLGRRLLVILKIEAWGLFSKLKYNGELLEECIDILYKQ